MLGHCVQIRDNGIINAITLGVTARSLEKKEDPVCLFSSFHNDLYNFFFLFSFFFLFIGERERERELTSREEREKQTPDEQGTRCRTRSQDPGTTTRAEGRHLTA